MVENLVRRYFLLSSCERKNQKGFTLTELIVVLFVMSILTAISVPSILNQTRKAKQAEAITALSAFVNAQAAYRSEYRSYASSFQALALGLPTSTDDYNYSVPEANTTFTAAIATAKDTSLKGYSAASTWYAVEQTNPDTGLPQLERTISSIVCEADFAGTTPPALPEQGPPPTCPASFSVVGSGS
ncbi:prepilin-type N-terminal cleavage/methylation domain-containing protein [Synechococcales cyanobacterium C]|uniref:Prepilin-type N-terminal cleavage/methylation domain-containing protein n=1 Tax=Petrachloros mirabilis ULC683 TaxID=2781853 RepID=A0A8K2A167_9CYAN|nr:prepilin-type N-terminal cleavage/methylation domain-containing protein [Petrachloros mirabilis ULC683]